ncbi:OsmC family protein [Methylobacterium sp. J-090]|uniref:OsmC family protein n=1 Tax=Methylobacterium sp. J-090 TaxID=2836666 RepID=UPI001FBBD5ED|nr:OsmC family protein [Methylobacterium sp. J-090]MCJ2080323.1 OsmC family protein [Methylobacterium sp. J-090]
MALPPIKPGSPFPDTVGGRRLQAVDGVGKSDPTAIRTLRCRTVAQGHLRQLNYIRDLPPQSVVEDEPDGLLGETSAPNASEALLAAFGSCLSIGIHANALAQGIPVRALELGVEADINTTAAWGTGDLHPKTIGFEAIRVSVKIDADASRKTLDALVKHAVLWSPVANTLHNPVHLDVMLELAAKR